MIAPREFPSGLRVWWIRNYPGPADYTPVDDVVEALHVYGKLIHDDLQDDRVWGNVGGLQAWDESAAEWYDWDYGLEFEELTIPGVVDIDSFDDVFDAFIAALRGEVIDDDEGDFVGVIGEDGTFIEVYDPD